MMELLLEPAFWLGLFSMTLVQVALDADNLIIITIIANKIPPAQRKRAVQVGMILAILFRIVLLGTLSAVLRCPTGGICFA